MKEIKDFYYKQAKKEGYVARSAFKIKEIQEKKHFMNASQKVLELGAAPGSWSQYVAKVIGPQGFVLGIDLKERQEIAKNAPFIQGDIFDISLDTYRSYVANYSGIISDMAPNTTGHKQTDHLQSAGLCEKALYLSLQLVKQGGYLLVKIFQGSEFDQFLRLMRKHYAKVSVHKPKSSRKESKEIFILGQNKKEIPCNDPEFF